MIASRRIGERLGLDLHFKFEGMNPTGSFKDRGMVVAVAKAMEAGRRRRYLRVDREHGVLGGGLRGLRGDAGARALSGRRCRAAKVAQTRAVGAELRAVEGSFDEAMRNCVTIAEEGKYVLVNSLNPNRIEGQKTAVFEIVEQLGGRAPDILALPYGGGGNTVAYAKGFQEEGIQPRMISAHAVERGTTMASAIRIAEPVHIHEVEALVAEGRVEPVAVADEDITRMWLELAKLEGIFCEPSSAAGLAAIAQLDLQPGATVVCVLTGHGLKDTAAVELHTPEAVPVEPTKESILSGVSS